MTQQELADSAGVDLKTIGNLERRGRWPIARTRARIEKALDWRLGDMERLAAESPPAISPDLLAAIRRTYPDPADQQRVIDAVERTMRGEPPPSAQAEADESTDARHLA